MTRYLEVTRSYSYSLLFALPLFMVYEAGAFWLADSGQSTVRNGADALLRSLLAAVGLEGTAVLAIVVVLCALVAIVRERRRKKIRLRLLIFVAMFGESLVYALSLGVVVGTATRRLLDAIPMLAIQGALAQFSTPEAVILSLGAGLYEELVFRVLLVGGLFALFRGGGAGARQAGAFAVILAALTFAAFHYVGPYGDAWEVRSFLYRFLAALAFSLLFLLRGFGITAWTHALYDVILVAALSR